MEQAEPDPGPSEQQIMDWNIHNDHAAGADAEPDAEPGYWDCTGYQPAPEAG
jgi:hypothetical protein